MVEEVFIEKRVIQDQSEAPARPLTRGLIDLFALKEYILRVIEEAGVTGGGQEFCLTSEIFPSSSQVIDGTITTSLELDSDVALIAINGVIIRPSEYTRNGVDLTITPLNGFDSTTDLVSIFQNKVSSNDDTVINATYITNAFENISDSQIFNPSATDITSGSGVFGLTSDSYVVIVTINGQVIPSSEYTLVNDQLTITPANGFADPSDVIAVYQSTPSVNSQGGLRLSYKRVTADYTIKLNDYLVESSTDLVTLTLYDATNQLGNILEIKNSSTGNITVTTQNSQLIDGSSSISLGPLESLRIASNGQKWIIINN